MLYVEFVKQRVEVVLALLAALLDHLEHRAYVLFDRQPAEYRGFLRQVADAEPGATVHWHRCHVEAVDLDRALVHGDQPGHHVEAGRLASAVGSEQPYCFAGPDAERDTVHDAPALVAFGQALGDQGALEGGDLAAFHRGRDWLAPIEQARQKRRLSGHYCLAEPGSIFICTRPLPLPFAHPSTWARPDFI